VLARIEESFGADTAVDVGGLALVTGAALGIVWGLVRGNSARWGSLEVLVALLLGAAALIAFVAWELRAREPMLPLWFFRSRAFSSGNATSFFLFASLFGGVFFFAQFLQIGLGHGPLDAGLRLVPWTATLFVVAPVAGALADRIGERPLMVAGLSLEAVGMAWVALVAEPGVAYGALVVPMIVAGIGTSMGIPAAQNAVVGSVAAEAIGKAAGANSMLRELGGVFGIAIVVAVFAGTGGYASAQAFSDGFVPAIAVAAALALAGAMTGMAMPGGRRATAVEPGREIRSTPDASPCGHRMASALAAEVENAGGGEANELEQL
jgi:Na+/melibiose symporter-like transporter